MTTFPSFLRLNNTLLCVCTIFSLSSLDGSLGGLHNLTIVNDAALNKGVRTSFLHTELKYFGKYQILELLDLMIHLFLIF